MIYLLSGTEFRLSEQAHETVKKVLLTMRFYCNLKQWSLSMSGRIQRGRKPDTYPICHDGHCRYAGWQAEV